MYMSKLLCSLLFLSVLAASMSIKNFFSSVKPKPTVAVAAGAVGGGDLPNAESSPAKRPRIDDSSGVSSTSMPGSCEYISLASMEVGWRSKLQNETSKPYFGKLEQFIESERKSHTIYPPQEKIFSAFILCPLEKVKVVIIGQDPYHGPNQAHGLAFSVQQRTPPPPSLSNIFKEINNDLNHPIPSHGNLEAWSKQGVFLLNTCLTVRKSEANSHQKHGWEEFTDSVVKVLSKKEGIVYLLWGNPAQTKCKSIDSKKNVVITCSHPSPLGAFKTNEPFMGSKCFSRCNDALIKYGKDPIDWKLKWLQLAPQSMYVYCMSQKYIFY